MDKNAKFRGEQIYLKKMILSVVVNRYIWLCIRILLIANIGIYSICHIKSTKSTKIKTDEATTAKQHGIFPTFYGKTAAKVDGIARGVGNLKSNRPRKF